MTTVQPYPLPDLLPAGLPGPLPAPVGIWGVGCYAPPRVVTNADLVAGLDTSDEWIRDRTGIRQRRWLDPERQTSDMCVAAAREAMHRAGVSGEDVDAIVLATFTFDQPLPSTALLVREAIGAHRALPLDLNQAACAGGVYGLLVGAHLLQGGGFRTVLVIGAEALSRVTDPADRSTRVFFGDAAGAVVLGRAEPGAGVLSWDFGAKLSHAVQIPAGGTRRPAGAQTVADRAHYLKMDGREVWREAMTALPQTIRAAVAGAGLDLPDVDHFFVHQANLNIVRGVADTLGIAPERVPTSVERLGNTGAATVFTVLHDAMTRGAVSPGDVMVLAAIGAGFLWGSMCLRHGLPSRNHTLERTI